MGKRAARRSRPRKVGRAKYFDASRSSSDAGASSRRRKKCSEDVGLSLIFLHPALSFRRGELRLVGGAAAPSDVLSLRRTERIPSVSRSLCLRRAACCERKRRAGGLIVELEETATRRQWANNEAKTKLVSPRFSRASLSVRTWRLGQLPVSSTRIKEATQRLSSFFV